MGLLKTLICVVLVVGVILLLGVGLFLRWDHKSEVEKQIRDGNVCVQLASVPCPEGTLEMYRDTQGSLVIRLCCNQTHDHFGSVKNIATNCIFSPCLTSNPGICSTGATRYINNGKVKLEYEEIYRESCDLDGNGGQGAIVACCVRNSTQSHLISRVLAEPNEFPHMAKVRSSKGMCGGTVYNSKFIITAAHCVVEGDHWDVMKPETMNVVLGSNIGSIESEDNIYIAKRVIPHPEYNFTWWKDIDNNVNYGIVLNDIALIELDKEIRFSSKVKSLQIAPNGFNPIDYSNKAVRVGWGRHQTTEESLYVDLLHKSNLGVMSDKACFRNSTSPFLKQLLCLGGTVDGKWSPYVQNGDSGGPGLCRGSNGRVSLCGIISMSPPDPNPGSSLTSALFMRVAYFNDWIKEVAGEQDEASLYQPYLYGESLGTELSGRHQVHIISCSWQNKCGGTLIAPDVVLTAAHCVVTSSGITGQLLKNLFVISVYGQGSGVSHVKVLEEFKMVGDPVDKRAQGNRIVITDNYFKSDLAVIKLKNGISPAINFPKLSKGGSDQLKSLATETAFPIDYSDWFDRIQLRQREFRFLSADVCNRRLKIHYGINTTIEIDEGILCGVEVYSGGSTCDRELGGGVFCKGEEGQEHVLCGVQVFRLCEYSIPNLFINVGYYSEWIKSAMEGF